MPENNGNGMSNKELLLLILNNQNKINDRLDRDWETHRIMKFVYCF